MKRKICRCKMCGKRLGVHDKFPLDSLPACPACWKTLLDRKGIIEKIYRASKEIAEAMWDIKTSCQHVWNKSGESIECFVCGEDGGWWCPDSKDGRCVYPDDGCGENCVKCGQPSERK